MMANQSIAMSEFIPGLKITKEEWCQIDTEKKAEIITDMQKGRLTKLYNRDFDTDSKDVVVKKTWRSKCYGNSDDRKLCFPNPELKTKKEMKKIFKNVDLKNIQDPQERVSEWYRNIWPQEDEKNFPYPYIDAIGLDQEELMRFSRVIHLATQPGEKFKYKETKEQAHCALFVHQTNEREIMDNVGSRRMNPYLKTLRDTDLQKERDPEQIVTNFYADVKDKETRMEKCEIRHESLSLEEAYFVGSGMRYEDLYTAPAVANLLREKYARQSALEIPAFSCQKPILGVPFAEYFVDGVDVPECSLEMLKSINRSLASYGVQVIDLRRRVENRSGTMHDYVDPVQTPQSAIQAVINCLDLLHEIQNTARYFVVYSFVLKDCPVHFLQLIVRFTPNQSITPIDFIDDGITRLKLRQPPLSSRRLEEDAYFYKKVIDGENEVRYMKDLMKTIREMSQEEIEVLKILLEILEQKKLEYDRSLKGPEEKPEEEPEEKKQEGTLKKIWRQLKQMI